MGHCHSSATLQLQLKIWSWRDPEQCCVSLPATTIIPLAVWKPENSLYEQDPKPGNKQTLCHNIVLPANGSCCFLKPSIISRLNLFVNRFRAVFPCQHCTFIQAFSYPGTCFLLHLHRQGSFNILLGNSLLGQWVRFFISPEHCKCSSLSSSDLADQDYTHSPAEELLSVQQLPITWASCLPFSLSYQCWNTIILQLINTLMCCLLLTDSRNACT